MTTATITATVSARKIVLLNRSALISAWPRYFPKHDFWTLRLNRPSSNVPPAALIVPWPNEEAWAESARAYHEERKRGFR